MALNTKGVFHFTSSNANLLNIISNGLYPSYCIENIIYGSEKYIYAIPMVSFCDIPLFEIKSHVDKYGSFAIGLTRQWAQKNKLNPIVYLNKNSRLAFGVKQILDFIFLDWHEWLDKASFDHFYSTAYRGAVNLIHSTKNFEGVLIRKGFKKKIEYYKEREWRYIPKIKLKHVDYYLDIFWPDEFKLLKKEFPKKPHFTEYGLRIKTNDIKYLIVPNNRYKTMLINDIKNLTTLVKNKNEFHFLISNILPLNKIIEDF